MQYRKLGRSSVKVSAISLGSWLTYGGGVAEDAARACVRRAFDLGINFFDTADVYNRGGAETVYGRELKAFRRQDIVLATKCFFPMSDNINDRGLSRKHVFESVHASLKRLQTDYIDLMQCHRYDPETEPFELVRAMDDLIRQGKILYWGVSEWPAKKIRRVCDVARQIHACPPTSEQPEYSMAARRVETNGVQQTCRDEGLGLVVWSPLKQGLLTGKYAGGQVPRDSRAASDKMNAFLKAVDRRIVDRVEQLRPIATRHKMTLAQLALAWLLKREAVASLIIGASRVEQVDENAAAAEFDLPTEDVAKIDALFPSAEFS